MNKKTWALVGVAVIALAVAGFMARRSMPSEGETQSNVADFAKSIDHTKADSPSVSPEQLALGRSGGTKGRGR